MKHIRLYIFIAIIFAAALFSGCAWNKADAVEIKIDGSNISADKAEGLAVVGGNIVITEGGTYLFSGYGTEVQITIHCEDPVELILDGFQLYNESFSAINVLSDAKVSIVSTGKEENVLLVGRDKADGCIESDGPLYFYGDTQLKMQGFICIKSDEEIAMEGHLNLSAYLDAVTGRSIKISGGEISIIAGRDGLTADKIEIEQGNISITGNGEKSRGIYSKGNVLISGGEIAINATDDGINAKDSFTLLDGSLTVESSDDAIHAAETAQISGGTIDIKRCLEGIESAHIEISGGSISIISDNDGLNAAFNDKDNKDAADIYISGGEININANGDGLDANGSIFVSGGVLFVSGANGGKNNAIDFDNDFVIDGGTVIAAGNNLGAKPPSGSSIQNSVVFSFEKSSQDIFAITDEEGALIMAADFPKPYDCIIVSLDSLILSENYYYGTAETLDIVETYVLGSETGSTAIDKLGDFNISTNVNLVPVQ